MSNHKDLKNSITSIRKQQPGNKNAQFENNKRAADFIKNDLLKQGTFYNDGHKAYFFISTDKNLIEIEKSNREYNILLGRYGINRSEAIYNYVFEELYKEAFEFGQKTKIHKLAYYNPNTFTSYVFNHGNQIYRINLSDIKLVDNGTDGVLFLSENKARLFNFKHTVSSSYIDDIIFSKTNFTADVLTPNERRVLLIIWFYALFFESIMPTKPILLFMGEKGSGKTTTLRKIGVLLLGDNFDVASLTDDPKDFDAIITNSAFVVIDNADSKQKWLNDKLAVVATGGKVRKRELYTTNRLVDFTIQCFLAITARTPEFRRDDVADRLLFMRVDRINTFVAERHLLDEIISNRSQIMSEVVLHIQEVITALCMNSGIIESLSFRMADFADFAFKLARYANIKEEVESIFKKLSAEQNQFTLENDPILELLIKWVPDNNGKEVTANDLYRELNAIAQREGIPFPYRDNVQGLLQHINNNMSNLSQFFNISRRRGRARKAFYIFTLKEDEI
ncbi:MAG: hypothetical protein A4E71_02823 [Smithella sp. PtaU1.Bin162]|nr:MAG: hypothetical protein A4E71_02823 [Smithella sp. PtaU1.Bin162]